MACTCVVGLQWGDEAKGKIVDLLTSEHDYVVRYNGGANAGHTVVRGGKTYKLSLLPTGILSRGMKAVIGNGVVVNPVRFIEEAKTLREAGIPIDGSNLFLSNQAHLIFPYHIEEEGLGDQGSQGSQAAIGTTGRGIGPCYQDKASRMNGIRVGTLLYPDQLRQRLESIVPRKNTLLRAFWPQARQFDAGQLCEEYLGYAQVLKPFITDTTRLLHQALADRKKILFEAAQGSLLDLDHGTYPFVTSSSSSTTGIWSGSGVPARNLQKIIGVIKAYTTRVGRGPFPTELHDDLGERIRKVGREYGTVTGRPRRCGWFDAVAVRHTARLGGVDTLALMLLDVLSGLKELKICVGYELNGEKIDYFPGEAFLLEQCRPIYETLPGWSEDISQAWRYSDLPPACRDYIERLTEILGLPVSFISVGPDRKQTILMS